MQPLAEAEIVERLRELADWTLGNGRIRRQYRLSSFAAAIQFVQRVATLAEAQDHHPDILIEYDRVTLTLSSHDAGGITARDFRLAHAIDAGDNA